MAKLRVLLSAYASHPNAGSEPGNGWNWGLHLAERGLDVTVLTAAGNQEEIEKHLLTHTYPGVRFRYIKVENKRISPHGGMYYLLWQFAAAKEAKALHAKEPFDIAHHVTLGSIHVPSQLWRLGLPVIFGPLGGGQVTPEKMLGYFGDAQRGERVRTAFTHLLPYSPVHRRWVGKMDRVLATNRETLELARRLGNKRASLYFDPGLPESYFAGTHRSFEGEPKPLRLLWVGRMMPRKALNLTMDILAQVKAPATLTVIGSGIAPETLQAMTRERNVEDRVVFSSGRIPWEAVREAYGEHDALFFTSLRDSCAAQLLEAMAMALPVITLDLHGGGSMVPDGAGIKIPVTDPSGTVRAGVEAVERYAAMSGAERTAMSKTALEFARTMSWPIRAEFAHNLYETVLDERRARAAAVR